MILFSISLICQVFPVLLERCLVKMMNFGAFNIGQSVNYEHLNRPSITLNQRRNQKVFLGGWHSYFE